MNIQLILQTMMKKKKKQLKQKLINRNACKNYKFIIFFFELQRFSFLRSELTKEGGKKKSNM